MFHGTDPFLNAEIRPSLFQNCEVAIGLAVQDGASFRIHIAFYEMA